MKHLKKLFGLVVCAILFVVFIYPCAIVIDDYQSDSLPVVGHTDVYLIWRCFNTKEAMKGTTVLYSSEYWHPCGQQYVTHFTEVHVIRDFWDGCEHNPEQNHTIAIDYANRTAYDFWTAESQSDGLTYWQEIHNSLEWMNAKSVVGYVVGSVSYEYGVSTLPFICIFIVPAAFIALIIILFIFDDKANSANHLNQTKQNDKAGEKPNE